MKYSMLTQLAIWGVKFYQKFISPYKGFNCPYGKLVPGEQSCSGFGMTVLRNLPFKEAVAEIKTRLHCCHEVNSLFRTKLCSQSKWGPYKTQGGFIDGGDCGGDCGSGPDCGDCGDCSGPDCGDCSGPDCDWFSSSPKSSFGADDAVELLLEVAETGEPATAQKKTVNSSSTEAAVGLGIGAAIIAQQFAKKKFILVAKLKNAKSLYRIEGETGCYLVDTKNAKEQLKNCKQFYVTEEEAKEIISSN